MAKPRDNRQKDLLRAALEDIIDLAHPLVRLAREIDWQFLDSRFASVCTSGPGQPPLPTRLVAGLFILKHMHDLSDEVLCARWLENPYYQFFCGEVSFCHKLPFERSSPWFRRAWRSRTRPGHWRPGISNAWWSTRRCSRKRSRIRPMPGFAIARWRSWSNVPSAMACRCGKAIGGWRSAR